MRRSHPWRNEAPRPQGGASRARSGGQNANKGNIVHIVPPVVGSYRLDRAYKAGLAGHIPVTEEP